jgi:hypothetical protein
MKTKTIIGMMLMLMALVGMTACDKENEDNPANPENPESKTQTTYYYYKGQKMPFLERDDISEMELFVEIPKSLRGNFSLTQKE